MDNYNDFQLPSDNEMWLMQEIYASKPFNRRTSLTDIGTLIHSFLSQYYGAEKSVNTRIRVRLESLKKELEKLSQNLALTFSFTYTEKVRNITTFNLFSVLKIVNQIIDKLHSIEENEDKAYYKTFARNTINSLLEHMNELYESLEDSFIHLFKYL